MKTCRTCNKTKPESDFYSAKPRILVPWCSDCRIKYCNKRSIEESKQYYITNALRIRLRKYGITEEQYRDQLAEQNGVCAICGLPESIRGKGGRTKPLAIDHRHTDGQVRGLLCQRCNTGLGFFGDDLDIMASAISYLQQKK